MAKISIGKRGPDTHRVDVDALHIDTRYNTRKFPPSAEKIKELAVDIAMNGQQEPIQIRSLATGTYTPVFGFTRIDAVKLINATPALRQLANLPDGENLPILAMVTRVNDREALVRGIAENRQRNDTSPIDDAHAQRRLAEFGMTQSEIAVIYGCKQSWISQIAKLLDLSDQHQKLVHEKYLTTKNGIDLTQIMPDQREEIIQAATTYSEPSEVFSLSDEVSGSTDQAEGFDEPPLKIDNSKVKAGIAKAIDKVVPRKLTEIKKDVQSVLDRSESFTDIELMILQSMLHYVEGHSEFDDLLDAIASTVSEK